MTFNAQVAGLDVKALTDTGATHVFITDTLCSKGQCVVQPSRHTLAQVPGGVTAPIIGQTRLRMKLGSYHGEITALVMPAIVPGVDLILGESWLKPHRARLCYDTMTCTIRSGAATHRVESINSTPITLATQVIDYCMAVLASANLHADHVITAKQAQRALRKGARSMLFMVRSVPPDDTTVTPPSLFSNYSPPLSQPPATLHPGYTYAVFRGDGRRPTLLTTTTAADGLIPQDRLDAILAKYSHILLEKELPDGVPPTGGDLDWAIRTEPGVAPPFRPIYRMSPKELAAAQEQIAMLLRKGLIRPSNSPYGAPVLFVQKKDGTLRMVVDYRALNKITVKSRYPLPRIDDLMDGLQGSTVFSSLDCFGGFYQLRIADSDVQKTAFRTPFGQYEFLVLPQGMANSPAAFQSTMSRLLLNRTLRPDGTIGNVGDGVAGVKFSTFVKIYVDDLCLHSKSATDHEKHLNAVLSVLSEHRLCLKRSKCSFNQSQINFLGVIVGRDGVKADPSKVATVRDWPVPKNESELRSFLGLANYFRKFIRGFSSLAAPLTSLTGKTADFTWTPTHQVVFEQIKEALCSAPVLALPDFEKSFTVLTDASLLGTGGVLMQEGRPVAFTSSKFSSAERNYTTTEQEMLAVVRALQEWRCYLESNNEFTVVTDHNALVHLPTQPNLSRRQARWMEFLARFHFKWEYRPGRTNVADPISRNPALAAIICLAGYATRSKSKSTDQAQHAPADPQPAVAPASHDPASFMDSIKQAYARDDQFSNSVFTSAFTLQDGYYIRTSDGLSQVVVPNDPTIRSALITEHHSPVFAGHVGAERTYQALRRLFWWSGMKADVEHHVRHCHMCQTNKSANQAPAGLLQPMPIPERPWEVITMDRITHLPKTTAGHTAILVFVDKLTKMTHLVPTMDTLDASEWARLFMDHVFKAHGLPATIISDRDTIWHSHFSSEVCKLLNIKQKLSTAFHPQTDGQTERMNRVLQDMLRHYVNAHQDNWHELLTPCEFAINNAYNESIKDTPFFLNYGFHPHNPAAITARKALKDKVPTAWLFTQGYEQRIAEARKCLEAAQARQKAYADKHRRHVEFQLGDQVLLSTKNIKLKTPGTMKLMPKWIGPFPVTKCIGTTAVQLALPPKSRIHNTFHVSLVKHYHADGSVQPPPPRFLEEDPIYTVEALIDDRVTKRGRKQVHEYLVSWAGYGPEHNMWVPDDWILDPTLISDYRKRKHQPDTPPTRKSPRLR